MKNVTSTFRLPEDIYEKIRIEAFENRVSLAEIIRRACELYFELKVQEGEGDSKN